MIFCAAVGSIQDLYPQLLKERLAIDLLLKELIPSEEKLRERLDKAQDAINEQIVQLKQVSSSRHSMAVIAVTPLLL